jgi:hypothetical protein
MYNGNDISPKNLHTRDENAPLTVPDAPSNITHGNTIAITNISYTPFSDTTPSLVKFGTRNISNNTTEHFQNAPRTILDLKFLDNNMPNVKGKNIRNSPEKKP